MYFKKCQHPILSCNFASSVNPGYIPLCPPFYSFGMPSVAVHPSMFQLWRWEGKGKWSELQQKVYIEFLEQNLEDMTCPVSRKTNKVFLKMSRQIKTRTPDQCRSHHQKVLKYHPSVQHIIVAYKRRYGNKNQPDCPKNPDETAPDLQNGQSYYQIKQAGNRFTINIQQTSVQLYQS